MSSERKSIIIDSASLIGSGAAGGGGSKRRTKRTSGSGERKIRPSSIVQPSTLKKTLLERIKQHQRTRERSRTAQDAPEPNKSSETSTSTSDSNIPAQKGEDNFSQSMDFLRKLALRRREQQRTQKKRTDFSIGVPEAKTPEAKMLNQVSETLKNGEILTNTGLLGLPVVPMLPSTNAVPVTPTVSYQQPTIHIGEMSMPTAMPMPASMMSEPQPETPPKITELADMYNNTVAAVDAAVTTGNDTASNDQPKESSEPPLHIPQKPEDYLPSIFIKEDPPHGCLKNGTKPTFREWATKMLNKPVDAIKNMLGGGSSGNDATNGSANNGAEGMNANSNTKNTLNNAENSTIDPAQVAGMRVKIRKTKKKRFRIGKHDDVVGVLLKNKQTQRHIQSEHLSLKQKTIGEIRKYLYDHHLLKIGSNAPPDVLRRMYEDAILTGDVKNTNKDVLLHNFMSGSGGE
jgi:hypothetical protein